MSSPWTTYPVHEVYETPQATGNVATLAPLNWEVHDEDERVFYSQIPCGYKESYKPILDHAQTLLEETCGFDPLPAKFTKRYHQKKFHELHKVYHGDTSLLDKVPRKIDL